MTYKRIFFGVAVLLFLSACAERRYTNVRPPRPFPKAPSAAQVKPFPPAEVYTPKPPSSANEPTVIKPQSPAVIALMGEAENQRRVGNLDSAVATVERAVRIEPRNAKLWHQLAVLRLQQDKPRLALDLAKKSNTLGRGDRALIKENWLLISTARRMLGDDAGAERALLEADR